MEERYYSWRGEHISMPAVDTTSYKLGVEKQEAVNHPKHYNEHPSGIECITIVRWMNFNLGNAVKYIWRVGLKSDNPIQDLRKAIWYLEDEIKKLQEMEARRNEL